MINFTCDKDSPAALPFLFYVKKNFMHKIRLFYIKVDGKIVHKEL